MSAGTTRSNKSRPVILLVEDDPGLRTGLAAVLHREGYEALHASDGETALKILASRTTHPALVILDLMLPDIDGLTILKHVRQRRVRIPVLVLSAKGSVWDKVTLLDAGADDYMVKPFQVEELLARVRALFKRFQATETRTFRFGRVAIDLDARRVSRDGEPVRISSTEFAILEVLLTRAGSVVSRDEIVDRVWDLDPPASVRVVDYHILQLRRKLEEDPSQPAFILTEPSLGYRIQEKTA